MLAIDEELQLGALHQGERNALRQFARFSDFQPVSKQMRVGCASMHSLVSKGFALEGPRGIYGLTFKLTAAGKDAAMQMHSTSQRRKQPPPPYRGRHPEAPQSP
jgi:hypothetical protein